jgi:CelD/BcsL family acetyltransferase involved in cellulose biosynthesis
VNGTFFSRREFIAAWAKAMGDGTDFVEIPVRASGPVRSLYAIVRKRSLGRRDLELGPAGLYSSPDWEGELESRTVQAILAKLRTPLTSGFVWNVRFDHGSLAQKLADTGIPFARTTAHAIHLGPDYDATFSQYNATIRNQVRRSRKAGVDVRDAQEPDEVAEYFDLHTRVFRDLNRRPAVYPLSLLLNLLKVKGSVRLLLARHDGVLAAGGLFFQDGNSVMYWHGAVDRRYSSLFPSCAVLDTAIAWAHDLGAAFVNLGGSNDIASLEQFKSFWGAHPEQNWRFTWMNPMWLQVSRARRAFGSHA